MKNQPFNIGYSAAALQQTIKDDLLCGLVLAILEHHQGRENAISRSALLLELATGGNPTHDRVCRAAINALRKSGTPICSTGGIAGGYFLAASQKELEDYIDCELHSRAMDLLEQEKAMRQGAAAWLQRGETKQLALGL